MVKSGRKWSAGEARRSAYLGELEIMFLGRYEHSIDDKGRMTIPARYRELLADGAFVTLGFDQNLMVLTADDFGRLIQNLREKSLTDPTARQLNRLMFSNADRVDVDKAGRILIPQNLRAAAHLEGPVVVIGAGEYFEIWAPSHWQQQDEELQDPEITAQRFATLDVSIK